MRTLLARCFTVVFCILVFVFPVSAAERISLTFDHGAEQLSGVPPSFRPQAEAFPATGGTRPRPDVRYVSYPVFGKSFVEIMKSVDESGPQTAGRPKRGPSSFEWVTGLTFGYDYTYEIDEDAGQAVVSLEIVELNQRDGFRITIPHLVNDTALNPIELSLYQGFLAKLLEQEHRRIEIVQDPGIWNELRAGIDRLLVFKVSLVEGMDIERTIESILSREAASLGKQRAKRIQDRMSEFDRKAAGAGSPGGR